jgi:cytosine/adenosine deaminase-related metal-dependent hydrolase
LATGQRGVHPTTALLEAATAAGHRSLGWPEGGRIAREAPADLVTVRLDSVRLAGSQPDDVLDAVVYAGTASDVAQVMAGGRFVVRDGRHADLDVAAELAELPTLAGS